MAVGPKRLCEHQFAASSDRYRTVVRGELTRLFQYGERTVVFYYDAIRSADTTRTISRTFQDAARCCANGEYDTICTGHGSNDWASRCCWNWHNGAFTRSVGSREQLGRSRATRNFAVYVCSDQHFLSKQQCHLQRAQSAAYNYVYCAGAPVFFGASVVLDRAQIWCARGCLGARGK